MKQKEKHFHLHVSFEAKNEKKKKIPTQLGCRISVFLVDPLILAALFISIQLLACAACSHSSAASLTPSKAIMEMCVMTNSAIL